MGLCFSVRRRVVVQKCIQMCFSFTLPGSRFCCCEIDYEAQLLLFVSTTAGTHSMGSGGDSQLRSHLAHCVQQSLSPHPKASIEFELFWWQQIHKHTVFSYNSVSGSKLYSYTGRFVFLLLLVVVCVLISFEPSGCTEIKVTGKAPSEVRTHAYYGALILLQHCYICRYQYCKLYMYVRSENGYCYCTTVLHTYYMYCCATCIIL